jgi:O-antigen/teichoic acid export membrane protein
MDREKDWQSNLRISGSLLARNTLLNLIGQVVPLLVGVVTIPFIVRGLGTECFGLLSLAWVVLGYFTIFDLGLGRATTKFIAEALGKGKGEDIPRLVWTAVTAQVIFGVMGAFVLVGITPLLVERILSITPNLVEEAKTTFYLLALSVPVVLVSGSFSGVLEAAQRFDLVNAVKIPASSFAYLLPLVGLLLGFRLPGIVVLILLARSGALVAFVILSFRLIPGLKRYSSSFRLFPRLFSFGGWITVSNMVGPILMYLDRFLIGSLLSMEAVAYYTAPFEVVSRLWIIPGSLVVTLFPAFSTLSMVSKEDLQQLYVKSIKYLLLVIGPIILIFIIFASNIIQLWLGSDYGEKSGLIFQILLLGSLFDVPAVVSGALIQGLGYPEVLSKLNLLYLPLHIGLTWLFVHVMGISGAALSFAFRTSIYTVVLSIISLKLIQLPFHTIKNYLIVYK